VRIGDTLANIHRRHMTKSAKAMVAACMFPEKEQGKRTTCINLIQVGVSKQSLSHARAVIEFAPDLGVTHPNGANKRPYTRAGPPPARSYRPPADAHRRPQPHSERPIFHR
jgi:hypothetical protein